MCMHWPYGHITNLYSLILLLTVFQLLGCGWDVVVMQLLGAIWVSTEMFTINC